MIILEINIDWQEAFKKYICLVMITRLNCSIYIFIWN